MAVAKDERVNNTKGPGGENPNARRREEPIVGPGGISPDALKQQNTMNTLSKAFDEAATTRGAAVKGPMGDSSASASTQSQADNLDTRQRLWDSLSYSYGRQQEESDKAYDKAISQADRQLLSRGMQRSSYGAQTLASLGNQKINAQRSIQDAMIADYEGRLAAIDENEAQRAFTRSEREASQAWQSGENERNRAFTTSEREASQAFQSGESEKNRAWESGENEKNRAFTTSERLAQQDWQSGENEKNRAHTTSERIAQQLWQSGENAADRQSREFLQRLQQDWQSGENAANREWQTGENEANRNWQTGENEKNRNWQTEERIQSQLYQTGERNEQQAYQNWQNDKDYERKIAASWLQTMAENGQDPSDQLLTQAGISREDYNRLKKQLAGTGTPNGNNNGNDTNKNPGEDNTPEKNGVVYNESDFNSRLDELTRPRGNTNRVR